jgi:hypothetical protein
MLVRISPSHLLYARCLSTGMDAGGELGEGERAWSKGVVRERGKKGIDPLGELGERAGQKVSKKVRNEGRSQ